LLQLAENLETLNFPATTLHLDSGLTLIHQHLPATPATVVDVWVKAGAIAEPVEWGGMAHFLEHMVFKGTKTLLPGVFDREIEYRGGATNAATSHDYAHFFLTTASSYLPDTLPYLAEILLHASIPDEEFVLERDVVLEELRASLDDPDWIGFQALCESLYQHHPYGRSILGNELQLLNHSPNQMRCFHQTHYQPENMAVVMVGGTSQEEALCLVERNFSDFAVRSECPLVTIEAEPPLVEVRRTQIYFPRLAQGRLVMAWMGPGIDRFDDALGLDLISAVLTGGRSSRLVRSLREERQLVLDIDCSFSLQKDSSLFTISAWVEPSQIDAVEAALRQHLSQLQQAPIAEAELRRAQRLLCHDFIFSTETPGQLAGLYGYYQTLATAELSAHYPHRIAQLTAEDLQRLALQYLSPERYAITLLYPCQ
jgi:predicted Zn-dependent peptidase